ncbi:hypothetical protein H072_3931 [Dactylellina haptotyla CBS 200.50]|uniref:Uncharacterized protein n=1 Tax=Dactylellina haptotyla (strain CBS 200.50) TaxID=1284197 RepID=S8ALP9_DACHA|nr:hypothetical protein H072_3931 [Dactylellina haptotyla CBS 200.50]
MKKKDRDKADSKVSKERRPSRRQSIFSVASSYFGPLALGSDISLDRQISPALQTSHVFFHEDGFDTGNELTPSRSPFSLSRTNIDAPDDSSPKAAVSLVQLDNEEPDLPSLTSPQHPSPPAPSLVPSAHLTPTISGRSSSNDSTDLDRNYSRRASRRPSSFFVSGRTRKASVASFMSKMRDLPSRMFKHGKEEPKGIKSRRSTAQSSLSGGRKPTKAEKAALKRKKSADKYIQKKTKKRLRQFKREIKRRMDNSPEGKEAQKQMGKTEKLLKVMDSAKEKFWEWVDRREDKRRRKETRAYSVMREERRKSVLLVPVERDYEVVRRRESRYSVSTNGESMSGRIGLPERP